MTGETRTLIEGLSYLECPRWRDGRIWFSDFYTYAVYSAQADGTDLKKEVDVPQQPSGLGWLPMGECLSFLCAMRGSCASKTMAH